MYQLREKLFSFVTTKINFQLTFNSLQYYYLSIKCLNTDYPHSVCCLAVDKSEVKTVNVVQHIVWGRESQGGDVANILTPIEGLAVTGLLQIVNNFLPVGFSQKRNSFGSPLDSETVWNGDLFVCFYCGTLTVIFSHCQYVTQTRKLFKRNGVKCTSFSIR